MLARYPHSIAMGNAVPEAIAAAKHITRSCDDNGIAHALLHILSIIPEVHES